MVVHDIKGEKWALTAGWRRREPGSACLKFDPTAAGSGESAEHGGARYLPGWNVNTFGLSGSTVTLTHFNSAESNLVAALEP